MIRSSALGLLITLAAPLHADTAKDAQVAWDRRDETGQTERSIQLWQEVLKQDPSRADVYLSLTKACGRAYRHADPHDRQRWADMARQYGAKAVELSPRNSYAYAAYAEALGQWAQAHKGPYSLGIVKQAVAALQKAIELDPKNSYAHMLLSSFYREAPSVISVGDKKKALEEAKLAVEYGPGYAINHLTLARAYLKMGQTAEATQELKTTVALKPPADAVPETKADQEMARKILREKNL